MRNISYYLAAIVLFGVGLVSFWIYQKYFKTEQQSVVVFQVARGDLREAVNVRGEVVAQKEFELEFPFGGVVERVYAKEGDAVKAGDALIKLETKEFDFEKARLQAVLAEKEAVLSKLLGGTQVEELRVSEAKVTSADQAFRDSEKTLLDAVRTSFTLADDAIHNKADQFFNNPRASNVSFGQTLTDTQLKTNLEADRYRVELALDEWSHSLPLGSSAVLVNSKQAQEYLLRVKLFLLDLATAVNSLKVSSSVTQTTLDGWKESVLVARTAVDGAITTVVAAEEKVRTADSALSFAQSELALKKSKPRSEDVVIAEAQIEQTKNVIASIDDKIRKSTLRAPGAGVVKKLMLENQEVFKQGMTALVFASSGYKIQSDVSELDIGKVRYVNGNDALIRFDAFPNETFKGKVVFVEPKEVIKNEDVYFRTDIFLDDQNNGNEIRSGMSADVTLYGVSKKDVLVIPELAIEKREGRSFVKMARNAISKENVRKGDLVEQEVTTGISDGESIEVLTGLAEGDIVAVSAD